MAQVVITQQESPKYSENLFPLFTAFNEPYTGWNIMSGVGAVANSDVEKYKGNYSLRVITNEADTVLVFDSANDGFEFTAPKTGNYIFSVKVFIPSDYDTNEVYGVFDTYVNGSGIGDYQFEFSNQASSFEHDKWNNFFQVIQLTEGDEYNLSFKFYADAIGCRAYLDGFKMELDDRNLVLPSRYTFPLEVESVDTGWQQITDSTYTSGSPLSIAEGVTGKIQTGTITEINTQLPTGVTTFWNNTTDKITAVNNGDAFSLSLRFKAKMDVLSGYFDVGINIGGSFGVIAQKTELFTRASNTEQRFTVELDYFTGTTFIANGGIIEVTPINGDIEIYDIVLLITRTHKGI